MGPVEDRRTDPKHLLNGSESRLGLHVAIYQLQSELSATGSYVLVTVPHYLTVPSFLPNNFLLMLGDQRLKC